MGSTYGNLRQGYGFSFPTMLSGLTLNVGQNFRLLSGAEYGANLYPSMSITTNSGVQNTIAPVPDMFSVFVGGDYFFKRNKAFSLQLGWRRQNVTTLNNNSSGTYLNLLSIHNDSYFMQIGLTFQIGDINKAITNVLPVKDY